MMRPQPTGNAGRPRCWRRRRRTERRRPLPPPTVHHRAPAPSFSPQPLPPARHSGIRSFRRRMMIHSLYRPPSAGPTPLEQAHHLKVLTRPSCRRQAPPRAGRRRLCPSQIQRPLPPHLCRRRHSHSSAFGIPPIFLRRQGAGGRGAGAPTHRRRRRRSSIAARAAGPCGRTGDLPRSNGRRRRQSGSPPPDLADRAASSSAAGIRSRWQHRCL